MNKDFLYTRYKYYIQGFIVILLLFNSGCKKYLEVDMPQNQVLTPLVFENNETANAAMMNIYGRMFNQLPNPYHLSYVTGISSDELKNYAAGSKNIYTNSIFSTDINFVNYWSIPYNYIYQANAVFENCGRSTTLSSDLKTQLMAEARFIRAYWHFYLFNLFGDIPLVTTTDYQINALLSRTSKTEVYNQIVEDLNMAIGSLRENYVDANGLLSSNERIRPNKYTAMALLARVYLYNGQYEKAEEQANFIIDEKDIYDTVPLNNVFLANSKEAIWQLKPPATNFFNTTEGNSYILQTSPAIASGVEISGQLLSAFDSTDQRKIHWIGLFTDNVGSKFYYPAKYKIKTGLDFTEYSMIFRLGEQYLIRAEARLNLNKMSQAIADVDVTRERAGIEKIATKDSSINKEDLLKEILKERQRELFAEQGHRWFDLKRTGTVDSVMSVITPLKGGLTWSSNKQLWPIPSSELLSNPNLKQNPGYN